MIKENTLFSYFHAHSHKKTICMMDSFNIPHGDENLDTCIFYYISWEIKCYIDCQAGLWGPNPCSCCPTFYSLAPFFVHFALVWIITEINHQMAMKKSIHGVVDVQSLGSRHRLRMFHYWSISYLLYYKSHSACCSEKFSYCSEYSACCSKLLL